MTLAGHATPPEGRFLLPDWSSFFNVNRILTLSVSVNAAGSSAQTYQALLLVGSLDCRLLLLVRQPLERIFEEFVLATGAA